LAWLANKGAIMSDGSRSIDVTPTLTVHASYATGDYVGTSGVAMVFAGPALSAAGGGVLTVNLIDYACQSVAGELWLFDTAVTPPDDSAAWTITDAEMKTFVGVIPFSTYYAASTTNSVAMSANPPIVFKCLAGNKLYGCFVTRGAPSYASGDLTFRMVTGPSD
jgi:hypothetical protein